MSKRYYSYCCGKLVEKNEERQDLIRDGVIQSKGYHCSRCKKPLTVYGNPALEKDKIARKKAEQKLCRDEGIRGTKVEVKPNGDLYLINKLYERAELTDPYIPRVEYWVVFDEYANYLTAVKIKHDSMVISEEHDKFSARLKKARLCAIRMGSVKQFLTDETDIDLLKDSFLLKKILTNLGWEFRSDGRLK